MSNLLSTPDGNKYFNENKDYVEYIREKCGYEVSEYVREVFEEFVDGEIFTNTKVAALTEELDNFLVCIEDVENPVLMIKKFKKILPVLGEISNLLEEYNW